MFETYRRPETDPFLIEEAKRLANRIMLRQTTHPDFKEGMSMNEYFWLRCSNSITKDEVTMAYFPKPTASWDNQERLLLDAPAGFDFPAVTFMIHHNGLYHSAIGPVPKYFWSDNRVLYAASNHFVFNEAGQAYREDKLEVFPAPFGYIAHCPEAIYIKQPRDSDIGTRINPLEPSDYEMIGHYLNRIEQA